MAPGEGEGGGMQGEGMDSLHVTDECGMLRFVRLLREGYFFLSDNRQKIVLCPFICPLCDIPLDSRILESGDLKL